MELQKEEIIRKNLPQLIKLTTCSAEFLTIFRSKELFSQSDVQIIQTEEIRGGQMAASSKFYDLLASRSGSFEILLEVLKETNQTGALAVLNLSLKNVKVTKAPPRFTSKTPNFITDYLNQESKSYLLVCSYDCQLTCDWILESTPNCKISNITEIHDEVLELIDTLEEQTLLLVNLEESLGPIFVIEENSAQKCVFVTQIQEKDLRERLLSTSASWTISRDNVQWNNLSSCTKLKIISGLNHYMDIEGTELTNALRDIDSKYLVELLKGRFPMPQNLFRETIPASISYYVTRTLKTRYVITKKIFEDELYNDFVLFSGIERFRLSEMCRRMPIESSSNLLRNKKAISQFVYLENELDFEIISEHFPKFTVHHLEYREGKFEWKKTRGNLSLIQRHVSANQHFLLESTFVSKILAETNSHIVCISDTPGKGKSVLLANLAVEVKKHHKTDIVAFIPLKELIQSFKQRKPNSPSSIIQTISQFLTPSTLGYVYLSANKHYIKELMLDGFDEIDADDTDFAFKCINLVRSEFLKTRIWITSRPHMLPELERRLETLGYNITPFSKPDQILFLSSFWSGCIENCDKDRVSQFAKECLKTLETSLGPTSEEIAGIPLQCLLIGEAYEEDAKRFLRSTSSEAPVNIHQITTIAELYQKLIDKMYRKFTSRYNCNKLSKSEIFKAHFRFALELLFPSHVTNFSDMLTHNVSRQEILDFGLIEAKSVLSTWEFLHRTFAEYFVALFVSKLINKQQHLTKKLFNFLFVDIMMTKQADNEVPLYLKAQLKSVSQFQENVICYFLNTFLDKADIDLAQHLSSLSTELIRPAAVACVIHNLENLYAKVFLEYKLKNNLINEDLLVKAVYWTDVHFLNIIMNMYLSIHDNTPILKLNWKRLDGKGNYCKCSTDSHCSDCKCSEHIRTKLFSCTLLHVATIKSDYATIDFLIKNHFRTEVECNHGNKYIDLIRSLLEHSNCSSDLDVSEKRLIVNYLLTLNTDLLAPDYIIFSLEAKHPHLDLVLDIWNRAKKLCSKINVLRQILISLSENLSSENFYIFMKSILLDLDKAAIEKVIHAGDLLKCFCKIRDLHTELLTFLKDQCWAFRDVKSDDRIYCFKEYLEYGEEESVLKWLLLNLPYTGKDIKALFKYCLSRVNLTGLNVLCVYIKELKGMEKLPGFFKIFEFLFGDKKISSITDCITIFQLVSYVLWESHSNFFEKMDFETTLTNLINLGFQFFDKLIIKKLVSNFDGCIIKLIWLLFICSFLKKSIFGKWLNFFLKDIDMKTAHINSGNNLLHIFALGFSFKEYRIKYSFLYKIAFSRHFYEMCSDKYIEVNAPEFWNVMVENGISVLQLNKNIQTPICLLSYNKYYDNSNDYIVDAILFAANHIKGEYNNNMEDIHQLFYLVIKSHSIKKVKKVYEWYAEVCESQNVAIENVTVTFNNEVGNFLDAATKSGNGDVIEFVVNTIQISIPLLPPPPLCTHLSISAASYQNRNAATFIKFLGAIFPNEIIQLVNQPNNKNLVPLSYAAKLDSDIVKVLHDFGGNVNATDDNRNTPLHFALMHDDDHFFDDVRLEVVDQLIKYGANINAKNLKMETPISIWVQHVEFVLNSEISYTELDMEYWETLLRNKADPSIPDKHGNTSVHHLVQKIYSGKLFHRMVEILFSNDFVDVLKIQNNNDQTPLQLANEYFNINENTKELLKEHGIYDF